MTKSLFTSEAVTEGHPDKIADQISDAILDAIIGQDPNARVAAETLVTTGLVLVAGELPPIVTLIFRDWSGVPLKKLVTPEPNMALIARPVR